MTKVKMPEPVAWLSKYGHMQGNSESMSPRHVKEYSRSPGWESMFTLTQLKQYGDDRTREALEMAAQWLHSYDGSVNSRREEAVRALAKEIK